MASGYISQDITSKISQIIKTKRNYEPVLFDAASEVAIHLIHKKQFR
jgi:hypothetical protein